MTTESNQLPPLPGFPETYRWNVVMDDGSRVGFSTSSKNPDDVLAAFEQIELAHEQVRAFNALPREQLLEYYLNVCIEALTKILPLTQIDVKQWADNLPHQTEYQKQLDRNRLEIFSLAESALIEIPYTREGYKVR